MIDNPMFTDDLFRAFSARESFFTLTRGVAPGFYIPRPWRFQKRSPGPGYCPVTWSGIMQT